LLGTFPGKWTLVPFGKCTLIGNRSDIPLELTKYYYNQYAVGKQRKVTYQQYPKRDYEEMDLFQKIEELESFEK
jgi:hypothetical protein